LQVNRSVSLFSVLLMFTVSTALAQKADVAFVVGGSLASDATINVACPPPFICVDPLKEKVRTGHQFYWEGAGAWRIGDYKAASLYIELPVAFVPSQRVGISGSFPVGTIGHLNSTFVTPSLKVKLFPKAPLSPFATVGGGWARYSFGPSTTNKGALQFGGGLDIKTLIPHLALRFEVRDFLSSNPNFGRSSALFNVESGFNRHNVLAGGGPVFTF